MIIVRGNGLSTVNRTNAGARSRVILGQSSGKCCCASSRCSSEDSRRDPIGQYSIRSTMPRKFSSRDTRSRSEISRFNRLSQQRRPRQVRFPFARPEQKHSRNVGNRIELGRARGQRRAHVTSRVTFNGNTAPQPVFSTIRMMKKFKQAPLLVALAATLAPFAAAQFRHPAYLHARSDLRRATLLMRIPDEPNVNRDMAVAARLHRARHSRAGRRRDVRPQGYRRASAHRYAPRPRRPFPRNAAPAR